MAKGRQVNLVDIPGIKGNTLTAFKVTKNNRNQYFSSEEGYKNWLQDNENRFKCIDYMFEIMEYKKTQQLSTRFYKFLKEWRKGYTYDIILFCMQDSIKRNSWMLKKEFDTEESKVAYLCAVFRNNLNDAKAKYSRIKKIKAEEAKDISLQDINITKNIGKDSNNNSDVSNYLGEI